jgi:hypothetical protein
LIGRGGIGILTVLMAGNGLVFIWTMAPTSNFLSYSIRILGLNNPYVKHNACERYQETFDSYKLEYLDYWTHPETGDKFSHGWRVRIPKKDIELVVTPTVEA